MSEATATMPNRQSELTWYSRLAIWIGCAMLLVQSILGRDVGPVSLLAVLLVAGGLVCFLTGLVLDAPRAPRAEGEPAPRAEEPQPPALVRHSPPVAAEPSRTEPPQPQPKPQRAREVSSRRPKYRERSGRRDAATSGEAGAPHAAMQVPASRPLEPTPVGEKPSEGRTGVATALLTAESDGVGQPCPRCDKDLTVGQLAATCPVCGRVQHAVCWMENYFHCSTEGCSGEGSLEAVRPASAPPGPPLG